MQPPGKRLAGNDRVQAMGGGDNHPVRLPAGQQRGKVVVNRHAGQGLRRPPPPRFLDVAHGGQPHARHPALPQTAGVGAAHIADTNNTYAAGIHPYPSIRRTASGVIGAGGVRQNGDSIRLPAGNGHSLHQLLVI